MLKSVTIEYDLKNGNSRKAVVVGTSENDITRFLQKINKNQVARINNIGFDTEIHAVTDEGITYIFKKLRQNNSKILEELNLTNTKEVVTEPANQMHICPWCEKEFEKLNGLKMHISKMHISKTGPKTD